MTQQTHTARTQPQRSMIVAERGGAWAGWAERYRSFGPNVLVLLQRPGERIAAFSSRVRTRLAQLEGDSEVPRRAVLVGGGRTDRAALAARSLVIRSIASSMAGVGGGTVVLQDARADRYSMAALAATVSTLVRGTGVSVQHGVLDAAGRSLAA